MLSCRTCNQVLLGRYLLLLYDCYLLCSPKLILIHVSRSLGFYYISQYEYAETSFNYIHLLYIHKCADGGLQLLVLTLCVVAVAQTITDAVQTSNPSPHILSPKVFNSPFVVLEKPG